MIITTPNPDKVASLSSRNQIDFTSRKDTMTTKKNNKNSLRLCVRFTCFLCWLFTAYVLTITVPRTLRVQMNA